MIPVSLPSLLSLEGMTAFIYMVMAAVKNTGFLPDRLVPLAAMALGAGVGAATAFLGHSDIAGAVLIGVVGGGMASGVEEARKGVASLTSRSAPKE